MARKYLDTTGLTALWAKIVAKINSIGDSFVKKVGDTMTGPLDLLGSELHLKTTSSSSNDSGDIVWFYGNGQEKARLWTNDTPTTAADGRLNFRSYNSGGTQLYSGKLATAGDVDGKVSKTGDTMSGQLSFSNTNSSKNIQIPAGNQSYLDGAKGNAGIHILHTYNADQWRPLATIQTKGGGSWQIGNYNNEALDFVNFTKTNIDGNVNTMNGMFRMEPNGSFTAAKSSVIADGSLIAKSPSMPANPSSSGGGLYLNGFYLRDAANDDYAYVRAHASNAEKGMQIEVRRSVNGSYVYNTLNLRINASGGRVVQLGDPAAWRTAIGHPFTWDINTNNTTDTWVPVLTGSTLQHRVIPRTIDGTSSVGFTRSHASVSYQEGLVCNRFGNIVTFAGYFSCGATIAANTTLYSGLPKPAGGKAIYFTWSGYDFYLHATDGSIRTNGQIVSRTYVGTFTYVCA